MEHTAAVYLMDKAGRFVSALDYHERHDAKLANSQAPAQLDHLMGRSSRGAFIGAPELQAVAIA